MDSPADPAGLSITTHIESPSVSILGAPTPTETVRTARASFLLDIQSEVPDSDQHEDRKSLLSLSPVRRPSGGTEFSRLSVSPANRSSSSSFVEHDADMAVAASNTEPVSANAALHSTNPVGTDSKTQQLQTQKLDDASLLNRMRSIQSEFLDAPVASNLNVAKETGIDPLLFPGISKLEEFPELMQNNPSGPTLSTRLASLGNTGWTFWGALFPHPLGRTIVGWPSHRRWLPCGRPELQLLPSIFSKGLARISALLRAMVLIILALGLSSLYLYVMYPNQVPSYTNEQDLDIGLRCLIALEQEAVQMAYQTDSNQTRRRMRLQQNTNPDVNNFLLQPIVFHCPYEWAAKSPAQAATSPTQVSSWPITELYFIDIMECLLRFQLARFQENVTFARLNMTTKERLSENDIPTTTTTTSAPPATSPPPPETTAAFTSPSPSTTEAPYFESPSSSPSPSFQIGRRRLQDGLDRRQMTQEAGPDRRHMTQNNWTLPQPEYTWQTFEGQLPDGYFHNAELEKELQRNVADYMVKQARCMTDSYRPVLDVAVSEVTMIGPSLLGVSLLGFVIEIGVVVALSHMYGKPMGRLAFLRSLGKSEVEEFMLSYSWAVLPEDVRTLAKAIWLSGTGCWIDVVKLSPGDKIRSVVRTMVSRVYRCVVFISKPYNESANCVVELAEALRHPSKLIICFLDTPGGEVSVTHQPFFRAVQQKHPEMQICTGFHELIPIVHRELQEGPDPEGAFVWWQSQNITITGAPEEVVPGPPIPRWSFSIFHWINPKKDVYVGPLWLKGNCTKAGLAFRPPILFVLTLASIACVVVDIGLATNWNAPLPENTQRWRYTYAVYLAMFCGALIPLLELNKLLDMRRFNHPVTRPLLASQSFTMQDPIPIYVCGDAADPVVRALRIWIKGFGNAPIGEEELRQDEIDYDVPRKAIKMAVMNSVEARDKLLAGRPEVVDREMQNSILLWTGTTGGFDGENGKKLMQYLVLVKAWEGDALAKSVMAAISTKVVSLLHRGDFAEPIQYDNNGTPIPFKRHEQQQDCWSRFNRWMDS
eukprot:gb/GEZN01000725.1/.p1 GENE.gb/GEZN01000725.1/~~gb/GEZN01000725.1/.p1  ORF type:complete len:1048 (-),score=158.59 gb/GEZN01000725.1/:137-3280(-)